MSREVAKRRRLIARRGEGGQDEANIEGEAGESRDALRDRRGKLQGHVKALPGKGKIYDPSADHGVGIPEAAAGDGKGGGI